MRWRRPKSFCHFLRIGWWVYFFSEEAKPWVCKSWLFTCLVFNKSLNTVNSEKHRTNSRKVARWRHQSMMDRELAGSPCCWRQQARRCWYHSLTSSSESPASAAMRVRSRSVGFRLLEKLDCRTLSWSSLILGRRVEGVSWAWMLALLTDIVSDPPHTNQ